MRIRVLSDLHLQHHPPPPGIEAGGPADVIVLAGDIHAGTAGIDWARRTFPDTPVLYVAGNHEAYDRLLEPMQERLHRAAGETPHVHVLEQTAWTVGDVRFLGCTFWTGFEHFPGRRDAAMRACRANVDDFRRIHLLKKRRPFQPRDADVVHQQSIRWLKDRLSTQPGGIRSTVVVTHHAPTPRSMDPRYGDALTSSAFVADAASLVRSSPAALWVHGHVHRSFDYRVGTTRVVCNPRGYPGENDAFDPGWTVEV